MQTAQQVLGSEVADQKAGDCSHLTFVFVSCLQVQVCVWMCLLLPLHTPFVLKEDLSSACRRDGPPSC